MLRTVNPFPHLKLLKNYENKKEKKGVGGKSRRPQTTEEKLAGSDTV